MMYRLPWRPSPVPRQPVIQALVGVGAENAVVLILQEPFHAGKELVIETLVGQEPMDFLFAIDFPRFREHHKIQFADGLLMLGGKAAANTYGGFIRADEQESPVRRDHSYHVQYLGHEVRQWARLNQESQFGGVVVPAQVVITLVGVPVDLD